MLGLTDARMIAYWCQKPPGSLKGGNEVDVYFAGSIDGGAHWKPPPALTRPGPTRRTVTPPLQRSTRTTPFSSGSTVECGKSRSATC